MTMLGDVLFTVSVRSTLGLYCSAEEVNNYSAATSLEALEMFHSEIFRDRDKSSFLGQMEKTGYKYQQKNGQRILGPPNYWEGILPQRGSEVFVAKIPRHVFEDELFSLFSRVGAIYQIRMMVDFSGTNRGFCFIQFCSPEDANTATILLNNYEIRPGKFIVVTKSLDNRRVYVGNIPKYQTKEQLVNYFREVVVGIVEVIVYQSVTDKSLNRGFVFLEFASHAEAASARRNMKYLSLGVGKRLTVDWAIPEPCIPDNIMEKVKILYVRNLLLTTPESKIWEAMAYVTGNKVVRVKKINDYAFVHFESREAAQTALAYWNNKCLDGSIIEVTWAKPLLKHRRTKKNYYSYWIHSGDHGIKLE